MPTVSLLPPAASRRGEVAHNPLPRLLHTPSGLAMVELQGSVLSEQDEAGVSTALSLGKIVFPAAGEAAQSGEWDGRRVHLFIGQHQRMAGEVKKLTKPLAVMRRKADCDVTTRDEVEIAEIVYFKMLFAHRPEPMGGGQEVLDGSG